MRSQLVVGIATVLGCATAVHAAPLDELEPGKWYVVDEQIRDVMPPPDTIPNAGGYGALITAWNSGAYDSLRERMIIWGGGHNDYGGNEVYTFDTGTMTWDRTWGPSASIPPVYDDTCAEAYAPNEPASRHTYDAIDFMPNVDRFVSFGGAVWCGSGGGTLGTWQFNFGDGTWAQGSDLPTGGDYVDPVQWSSAYDPVTGHMFVQSNRPFLEYDAVADINSGNGWTLRGTESGGIWSDLSAAIDPGRRLYVAIGDGTLLMWDMSTWTLSYPTTSGGGAMINANSPAFEWDPVLDRFVAWASGPDLYSLDPATMLWEIHPGDTSVVNVLTGTTWQAQAPDPGNPVPGQPADTGTYGRLRYIPSKNVYILVNSIDQPVYFTKLSPGAGTPVDPPDGNPFGDGGGNGDAMSPSDGSGNGDAMTSSDGGGNPDPGDGSAPAATGSRALSAGCACTGVGQTAWALLVIAFLRRRRS